MVYLVITLPPLAGAVQESATVVLPDIACTPVGAPGGAAGVTELEVAEAPVPIALIAATRKVYATPLVRPVMTVLVAGGLPVTDRTGCAVEPTYGVTA
jgi:hypothetical protein